MTRTVSAFSSEKDSAQVAAALIQQIEQAIPVPDAVIVFLSAQHSFNIILQELSLRFASAEIVGCSSAGEFDSTGRGEGSASAFAIASPDMAFSASIATNLSGNPEQASKTLTGGFKGLQKPAFRYRSALVLNDALAGSADELVRALYTETGGKYKFFGGGAGDDAAFTRTYVFKGTQVASNAAVALEILSTKPLGVGVRHGWTPGTESMRVTSSEANVVASLDAISTVEVFEHHAKVTGQTFDKTAPLPFFLHNIAGMKMDEGYKLRVPLGIRDDGGVTFAAEIPEGSSISIMNATVESSMSAAREATEDALRQLGDCKPGGVLMFDCVATRLRLGKEFGREVEAVRALTGDVALAGCNTYGQVASAEGQFAGFHNCNAVICVFPE